MSLVTYDELKASVAAWLHRTDLAAQVPIFIALAEAQMNRRLRVRRMVGRATANVSDEYSAVPDDFAGVESFAIDGRPLRYLTPEQIEAAAGGSPAGRPCYYSIVGEAFRYCPAPGGAYIAALTYWRRLPALSDAMPSNWVLADHPDAYLYGALTQAAPFVMDDERVGTWGALFTTALADIEAADSEARGAPTPVPTLAP